MFAPDKGGLDMVEMTDLKKVFGRFKSTMEQSNPATTGSNTNVMGKRKVILNQRSVDGSKSTQFCFSLVWVEEFSLSCFSKIFNETRSDNGHKTKKKNVKQTLYEP